MDARASLAEYTAHLRVLGLGAAATGVNLLVNAVFPHGVYVWFSVLQLLAVPYLATSWLLRPRPVAPREPRPQPRRIVVNPEDPADADIHHDYTEPTSPIRAPRPVKKVINLGIGYRAPESGAAVDLDEQKIS